MDYCVYLVPTAAGKGIMDKGEIVDALILGSLGGL